MTSFLSSMAAVVILPVKMCCEEGGRDEGLNERVCVVIVDFVLTPSGGSF
jgi:hypothetical protein